MPCQAQLHTLVMRCPVIVPKVPARLTSKAGCKLLPPATRAPRLAKVLDVLAGCRAGTEQCCEPAAPSRAHPAAAVHAADSCQGRQCCVGGRQIQRKGDGCSLTLQVSALLSDILPLK